MNKETGTYYPEVSYTKEELAAIELRDLRNLITQFSTNPKGMWNKIPVDTSVSYRVPVVRDDGKTTWVNKYITLREFITEVCQGSLTSEAVKELLRGLSQKWHTHYDEDAAHRRGEVIEYWTPSIEEATFIEGKLYQIFGISAE